MWCAEEKRRQRWRTKAPEIRNVRSRSTGLTSIEFHFRCARPGEESHRFSMNLLPNSYSSLTTLRLRCLLNLAPSLVTDYSTLQTETYYCSSTRKFPGGTQPPGSDTFHARPGTYITFLRLLSLDSRHENGRGSLECLTLALKSMVSGVCTRNWGTRPALRFTLLH